MSDLWGAIEMSKWRLTPHLSGRVAVEQDGADILVLGCMSMAFLPGICEVLTERVGVPVVNPAVAALKTAEAVGSMRISHSKVAWPPPKPQEII